VRGTVFYTDPSDCRLHALDLPDVRRAWAPDWTDCAFALGPGADPEPDGTVFQPTGRLRAMEIGGGVDVVDLARQRGRHFPGARAPSFIPDRTLTFVRAGELVALSSCRGRPPGAGAIGCAHALASERAITEATDLTQLRPRPRALALVSVAWLDGRRFVAVADAGTADLLLEVMLSPEGLTTELWLMADSLRHLAVSPLRSYVSVVSTGGKLVVFDAAGRMLSLGSGSIRAAAWLPDERWIAVATGAGIELLNPRSASDRLGPIEVSARDVAWE
jgi:hypothetical protein